MMRGKKARNTEEFNFVIFKIGQWFASSHIKNYFKTIAIILMLFSFQNK